jgi:hypothetical protein
MKITMELVMTCLRYITAFNWEDKFNIDKKNYIGSRVIFLTLTYYIILHRGLGLSPDWHICWNM